MSSNDEIIAATLAAAIIGAKSKSDLTTQRKIVTPKEAAEVFFDCVDAIREVRQARSATRAQS